MMHLPKLILASGSPRRVEILEAVGWEFEKRPADVDETPIEGEDPNDYVERLALEKARASGQEAGTTGIVLGADTTVVVDGEIVGKPVDRDDAERMIRQLSGRWHEVVTGVAVVRFDGSQYESAAVTGIQTTRVRFSDLSAEEVRYLVDFGDPLDKAGAYAVQAQAALFIEGIEGDYWNVVGLPVSLVYRLVREVLGKSSGAGANPSL